MARLQKGDSQWLVQGDAAQARLGKTVTSGHTRNVMQVLYELIRPSHNHRRSYIFAWKVSTNQWRQIFVIITC